MFISGGVNQRRCFNNHCFNNAYSTAPSHADTNDDTNRQFLSNLVSVLRFHPIMLCFYLFPDYENTLERCYDPVSSGVIFY